VKKLHPLLIASALSLLALPALAQHLPWQTAASGNGAAHQLVRFLYPQQVEVRAGKPAVVDLHFRIEPGLHINSHTPLQKSLIRTELIQSAQPGIKVVSVNFPPGSSYAFSAAPSEKLSVYTGELVVRLRIDAQRGDHLFRGALRYQACDTNTCFPPRNVPVAVDVIAH
jgi:hypothetical protein